MFTPKESGSDADSTHATDQELVDVTLIEEMLALTPTQRLQHNDRTLTMLDELRRGLEPYHPAR